MTLFSPFWTNATVAHEQQQHRLPCCSPAASLNINDLFYTGPHSKDANGWETIILSNYMIDFEWLCRAVPSLTRVQKQLVVLSGEKGSATARLVASSVVAQGERITPKCFTYVASTKQQDRRNSMLSAALANGVAREKLVILEPPLPYPYGTHHSKFILAINHHGIRVVICTANFIYSDWANKTQGIYLQDFPRKMSETCCREKGAGVDISAPPPPSPPLDAYQRRKGESFKTYLQLYLERCGLPLASPVDDSGSLVSFSTADLEAFDFSSARVWLLGSVPGCHKGLELMIFGVNRLAKLVEDVVSAMKAKAEGSSQGEALKPLVLTWQYSSQGSLNEKFLQNLQTAMVAPGWRVEEVQIIYPTENEVRQSLEGWRGGLSLPLHLRSCHPFVNERLHCWGSPSEVASFTPGLWGYALPHIKSYAALDPTRSEILWFVLTSGNLSQAAWGQRRAAAGRGMGSVNDSLFIRSYELGVLYDSHSFVCAQTGWFSVTPHHRLPLPTDSTAKAYLFATPVAGVAESKLYLPYNLLHPVPYASTTEFRQRREDRTMDASIPVSAQDRPWVLDLPHPGLDSLGCLAGQAVRDYSHYGSTSWMAPVRSDLSRSVRTSVVKRARSRD